VNTKHGSLDVTLAILAGGEGTRMGRPKGDLEINGKPILRYLLRRFGWRGPTLLVTAPGRERPPAHGDFDREAVDPKSGQGPLRGIITALENAPTELLVITTVDMPGVQPSQLDRLAEVLRGEPKLLGLMVRRGLNEDSIIEPFPSAFRRAAAPALSRRLSAGQGSVGALGSLREFRVLAAPKDWDDATWLNLNYPADVTKFVRRVATTAAR
jgi:molybdopterin-guanine dinucleotide biosynthesis protein A